MAKGLTKYRKKRTFDSTPEPRGKKVAKTKAPIFVIQKHYARSTHFDLRLQMGSTLKSWAVPKGLPKTIGQKHLAILTENHPLEYANFEGEIPKGHYGAGKVKIVDRGTYENVKDKSIATCFKEGVVEFRLRGAKLTSSYALVHFKEKNWLLIKVKQKR